MKILTTKQLYIDTSYHMSLICIRNRLFGDQMFTSLKANGSPRTPAPMKDMNMLAKILRGWVEPPC